MKPTLATIRNGLADAVRSAHARLHTPPMHVTDAAYGMTDADMVQFYHATGKLLIWSGGSDNTIYGDARINWLFRAWHDWCHIRSGVCGQLWGPLGCFEPEAEYVVADFQCSGISDTLARVVQLEVSGQARHHAETGTFIEDQTTWMIDRL